jgi:hypothetical protein
MAVACTLEAAPWKEASCAFLRAPLREVIAIVDKIPMIAMTTKSSIRVKPFVLIVFTFFTSLQISILIIDMQERFEILDSL